MPEVKYILLNYSLRYNLMLRNYRTNWSR